METDAGLAGQRLSIWGSSLVKGTYLGCRLGPRRPLGHVWEAAHRCVSLSVSLPFSPFHSLEIMEKISSGEDPQNNHHHRKEPKRVVSVSVWAAPPRSTRGVRWMEPPGYVPRGRAWGPSAPHTWSRLPHPLLHPPPPAPHPRALAAGSAPAFAPSVFPVTDSEFH